MRRFWISSKKNRLDKLRRELRKVTPAMRGQRPRPRGRRAEDDIHNQIVTIRTGLESVGDAGVLVKDIDMGLVDFPSLRDGQIVYLCWIIDEPDIAYWHDVDAGFQGRRPL
ncbi:MAG: DUF2203 domain-containing protein [Thermomicrobiales bacterium]